MREHAILSASGASKWIACPPSARLEEKIPESSNEYAEEGKRAHALAERLLKRIVNLGVRSTKDVRELDKEMMRHCTDYAVHVSKKILEFDKCLVEYKTDFSDIVPEGFGTIDAVILKEKEIEIIDFKYGAGKEVFAKDNPQLMLYALGVLSEYSELYDFDVVKLSIFQPRKGNVSEWVLSVEELKTWGEKIKPIAEVAFSGKGEFLPGKHCQWCRVKNICTCRAQEALRIAKFNSKTMSDNEISEILPGLADLEKWAKETREYARSKALEGHKWKGWKIVEGRGKRVFNDKKEVAEILKKAGYKTKDFQDTEIISLTALEIFLKKEKFEELLGPQISHSPGAAILVLENDPRNEILTKIEFKKEEII